jgi:hypothetical protein
MRGLIIITRHTGEYDSFWEMNESSNITHFAHEESKTTLIKKDDDLEFVQYASKINSLFATEIPDEIGIIFHSINDVATEDILKNALLENIRTKVKFCKWYSSVLSGFWNEQDGNAVLPYNNFKKAWKDNDGDKRKTFKAIWDFFDGDPILEAKLNLLHQCLTPNEAKKATQIPNYHLIKDVVESVKNK